MDRFDEVLQNNEKIVLTLRALYHQYGYQSYRMSKFEEYDFYARNKDFLVSDQVITFTDTTGKLMALKPDVTLSIIRNHKDLPDQVQKVFYNENVYRVSKGTNSFKELMQTGLECFGSLNDELLCEVIELAARSLQRIASSSVLNLSNLTIPETIIAQMKVDRDTENAIYKAIGEKNLHELTAICSNAGVKEELMEELIRLSRIRGSIPEVLPVLTAMLVKEKNVSNPIICDFCRILDRLKDTDFASMICVDFSLVGDTNYYNGLIFHGFIEGIPNMVLSGGQYDHLMQRMQRRSKAIGFAVYLDELERIGECGDTPEHAAPRMLNIALPKGRLGEKVYAMFARAGFECPSILEQNRKLIFENPEKGVRYFWVKPSDVAIYVERGAADIGVAGKDILLEYEPDVYELLDLNIGKCRMAVAGPKDCAIQPGGTLRVATKFSNIARHYYMETGRDIDIIHLNGSIELAPILGLSDVIVDIVETGTTLKENNLEVKENIVPISARLIANKSSYLFSTAQIQRIAEGLSKEKPES